MQLYAANAGGVAVNKLERQALTRLIDQLGADITLSHRRDPLPRRERLMRLANLEQPHHCPDGDRPMVTLLVTRNVEEVRRGRFGVGRPATALRNALLAAGLDRDDFAYVATEPDRQGLRAAAWEAVAAIDAPYVIAVGAEALRMWRADVRLQQMADALVPATTPAGKLLLGAIPAPEAVMRVGGIDSTAWTRQIGRLVTRITDPVGQFDPVEQVSWRCLAWDRVKERVCGDTVHGWDRLGMPWCKKHLVAGWDGATKAEQGARVDANRSLQATFDI